MSDRRPPDRMDETQPTESDGTQPLSSPRIPAAISGQHVQQPPPPRAERGRKRKANERKPKERTQSALYLPAWSVGLMLLLVFGIVGAIVTLVATLGGQNAPGGEPIIVIITAEPSATPAAQVETTPTSPNIEALPSFQGPIPTFGLEGPTLVPIVMTPTPVAITVGATVIVNVDGLNVRSAAGTGNEVVTFANTGERYTVTGGPQQASSLTWWQIQSADDPSVSGWAAADYLDVAIE